MFDHAYTVSVEFHTSVASRVPWIPEGERLGDDIR